MGKSNYPNKLDTSLEIPAVRDNIVEVGSDVLNSIRSAIFNIERTLGINPQGATGNTVASRVNRSLDGNGNILKEALDKAGLLSGPITDVDVSKVAGIDESKLKLKYPTTLLQDEISQLIKQIENISATLEELAFLYAAHTHPEAKNRHKGHAITIDAIEAVTSDIGMISSERQTAQELFEGVFSSHINYDGSNISDSNRSHEAEQLFFDKSEVSAYIYSEDVQGAIIDVLNQTRGQVEDHQNRHHSNGVLRTSVITGAEDRTAGRMLIDEQEVLYSKYPYQHTHKQTSITFVNPPSKPSESIERSDILRIYSGIDGTISDHQIHSVFYSGQTVTSINIFGALGRNSDPLDRVKVFKNQNAIANPAGLLVAARYFPDATNVSLVQVANPNSSTIISKGIRPSEISVSNRYMNVIIDGETEILIDAWDGAAAAGQSIDTVVKAMNVEFSKRGASVLAYRVDHDDLYSPEIALVHSLPSSSSEAFTLSVTRSSTDDGIDSLGFGHIEDKVIDQGSGAEYYIQGLAYSGLDIKLEQTGLTLMEGQYSLTSHAVGVDLSEYGIAKGDLLVVTNTASDNGTYVIENVSETSIAVDKDQLAGGVWNGESTETSKFYVLRSTVSLEAFHFLRPGLNIGNAAAIVDVFINKDREILYNTRLEYAIATHGPSDSLVAPCDFDGDISVYTEASPGEIEVSLTAEPLFADQVPQLSLDGGPLVELPGTKSSYIRLRSGKHNITLLVFIEDSDIIKQKIDNDGFPFVIELHGEKDINLEENLLLARVHFDSLFSRVTGAGAELPRIFKKFEEGVTSDKDLSSKALKRVYQGPIGETRSNGVTEGLKLTPSAIPRLAADPREYVVDIAGGACYVKGKKFIFSGYTDLISDIASVGANSFDKVFIAINEWGEIVFSGSDAGGGGGGSCVCPFNADSHCILAVIEFDGVTCVAIDLRLFLDNLDLKVLNSVTVSPQPGMGHFTEFGEALKYTKRFGDLFPNAGTPTIHLKSGTHKVIVDVGVDKIDHTWELERQAASYQGNWINFPVNIRGEGDSTVLDIMKVYNDAGEADDDRTAAGLTDHAGYLFIAGPGLQAVPNGNSDILTNGFVTLSNFKMKDCSIVILDPWTKNYLDAFDPNLNWGVKIDGLIFDRSEKADLTMHNYSVMFAEIDSDPAGGQQVGNLSISNCQFLNSYALFSGSYFHPADHRNMHFLNNTVRGTGDGTAGDTTWLVWNAHGAGTKNIFEFNDSPSANNIEYRGNINADSESVNRYIDQSGQNPWGDRISRNLNVGGFTGIGKNANTTSQLYVTNDLSGATRALYVEGDAYVQGEATVSGGPLTMTNGTNLVSYSGNIELEHGYIHLEEGGINLGGSPGDEDIGDIYVENGWARLSLVSTGTIDSNGSELILERDISSIGDGEVLGRIKFLGTENPITQAGAQILAESTSAWSGASFPTALDFWVAPPTGSMTHRMRLTPEGVLRINGGDNIAGGNDGCLQIGEGLNLKSGSGTNIAIDANQIQCRSGSGGSATSSQLHLNHQGGDIKIQNGMVFKNGNEIVGNLTLDGNIDIDHTLAVGGVCTVGGVFTAISTAYVQGTLTAESNLSVLGSAVIGSSTTAGSRAARFVGNSGVTNELTPGVNTVAPTVAIYDHQADSHDGCALWIELPNIAESAMEQGVPETDTGDIFIYFNSSTGNAGWIGNQGGSMVYGGFTGAHATPVDKDELLDLKTPGLIVSSNGIAMTDKTLSEPYVGTTLSRKEKDKSVLGVICTGPRLYDGATKFANWEKGAYGMIVNSVGNGRIWVTNITGDIENGDFICSSNIPGYGQLQDDDLMHNYTAAKSTETIDWDNVTDTITHNGIEYKKFLVACSYHCG